ncbi:CFEM domain-containing protein, partial [Colletotrichum cuscutae]
HFCSHALGTARTAVAPTLPQYPYESIQPGRHSTMRITKNITQTECGFPVEDDFAAVKIMRLVLFFTLPTFAIIIRLVVKIARISPWGFDDSTILLTYIIMFGFIPVNHVAELNGAGRDIWSLTFDQIDLYFLTFYIGQLLYVFTLTLIKSSILFMYLRIFPGEKFRWVLWTTQVVTVGLGMGSVFLVAFQCQPVGKAWKQWTGEENGHCVPVPPLGVVHGAVNIVLDVWMLILPASQVLFLNMKPRKKWAVMFMFSLGLFLTISSGIRLRAVLRYTTASTNPTVDSMSVAVWSDIELDVGIFTTCIPNIWQFVRRFILKDPKRVEKLSSRNAQNQNLEEYPQKSPAPASTEVGEEELR